MRFEDSKREETTFVPERQRFPGAVVRSRAHPEMVVPRQEERFLDCAGRRVRRKKRRPAPLGMTGLDRAPAEDKQMPFEAQGEPALRHHKRQMRSSRS